MKHRILVAIGVISIGVQTRAYADVGPAPTCPSGQHSEYLEGRRCVPDGMHLVKGPNGEVGVALMSSPPVATATDAAAATPTSLAPSDAATPSIPVETTQEPRRNPLPATVEPKRSGGCTVGASGDASQMLLLGFALLATRKRRHTR